MISRRAGFKPFTPCRLSLLLLSLCTLISLAHSASVKRIGGEQLKRIDLQIQGFSPAESDEYVAVSIKAEPGYIVKYEPLAAAERVHHMILYGCTTPASQESNFWRGGATCGGESHILWAWARNAPAFVLPDNVAFPIGNRGDSVQHLVLQIHYARPFAGNVRDFSGVSVHLSQRKPKYFAAVYLFVSGTPIPPRMPAFYSNMSCTYDSDTELHPFAFRTHTHAMGRVVSAYVKHASDGAWEQIGKRNPQWPQLFQHSTRKVAIHKGDFLAATCRFDSHDKDDYTPMGSMGMNEMCNFYMMFYRDADAEDPFPYGAGCFGGGDPSLMAREYPTEGTTLLPAHPEWELMARQSAKPFGIVEKAKVTSVGDQRLGQVTGLAFDASGDLVIFHRSDRTWSYKWGGKEGGSFDSSNVFTDKTPIPAPTVLVAASDSDSQPKLKGKYGKAMFYLPHGIFVDELDSYYTTDVGSHQVIKWKIENGELSSVWEFGEKLVPGSDKSHLCKPAGVVVSRSSGDIYIADGYCNNRVIKLNRDGVFTAQWGKESSRGREMAQMALGSFSLPHDVSFDEGNRRVYVTDRQNGRVQVFNEQGEPLHQITHPHLYTTVYSAHFSPAHGLFFIPGNAGGDENGGEIQAYVVPLNSSRMQYSFRPTSDPFKRPHILRSRGEDVWVGEIDERGGVLWHLQVQTEDLTHTIPFDMKHPAHVVMPTRNAAVSGSGEDESRLPYATQSDSAILLALNLSLFAFILGICYFSTHCFYRRFLASKGKTNRASQYTIDRTGFKPLKTTELESSDEESAEEDVIVPSALTRAQRDGEKNGDAPK